VHEVQNGEAMTLDAEDVKTAIWLFGGLYLGVNLPISAQRQNVWEVSRHPGASDAAGSWGGHAIYLVSYDAETLTCITWGQLKKMTWAWFEAYCDEAYALISKDWMEATGVAPSGFDLATLESDLKFVTA
jgi:hypothetical protein